MNLLKYIRHSIADYEINFGYKPRRIYLPEFRRNEVENDIDSYYLFCKNILLEDGFSYCKVYIKFWDKWYIELS